MSDFNYYKKLISNQFGFKLKTIEKLTTGVGGETFYLADYNNNKYIFKVSSNEGMNHPLEEPFICNYLEKRNLPVSHYVKTVNGDYSIYLNENRIGNLYTYIDGKIIKQNEVSNENSLKLIQMLTSIHKELQEYKQLPVGIGENFFKYMTVENAKRSYLETIKKAKELNNLQIINDLEFRISFLDKISDWKFDYKKLTYMNSHGDYNINQIIWDDDETTIKGIIDFTAACYQPVIWEITRSFYYGDIDAKNGVFNKSRFIKYLNNYQGIIKLNDYDLQNILKLYYYQIAVCDYYHQYFSSEIDNKNEYLEQAVFATQVLRNISRYEL